MPDAECANPLFLGWVAEWLDTARMRSSKGVTTYKKAYDSLKACPLALRHPSEAKQLNGFGDKLCARLTEQLKKHCEDTGVAMPSMPHKRRSKANTAGDDEGEDEEESTVKKPRKTKPYVPVLRSGPYAIIIALAELDVNDRQGIPKPDVIRRATPHSDASFVAPSDPGGFYTAWSSIKTLLNKDLVYEKGRPVRRYLLTEDGWEVANRIKLAHNPSQGRLDEFRVNNENNNREDSDSGDGSASHGRRSKISRPSEPVAENSLPDIIPLGETITSASTLPYFNTINLPAGSYTVELVLDNREVLTKKNRDYMGDGLTKQGVTPLIRSCALGDICWVAKMKDKTHLERLDLEGDEVVLDYIAERKRLDDLISSIKDGRFHEQKFRLKRSGIKNVIYIIEEKSTDSDHLQRYEEAVQTAIASMQVVNGFFVKKTQKMDDTITYLARMTAILKAKYKNEPLRLIPTKVLTAKNYLPLLKKLKDEEPSVDFHITYPAFHSLSSKTATETLREVYLKMLMCTRGVTGEKALEIQKRWKTPREFAEAYDACGAGAEGQKRKFEMVSKEMGNMVGRKKIAKAVSTNIAKVWGCNDLVF